MTSNVTLPSLIGSESSAQIYSPAPGKELPMPAPTSNIGPAVHVSLSGAGGSGKSG